MPGDRDKSGARLQLTCGPRQRLLKILQRGGGNVLWASGRFKVSQRKRRVAARGKQRSTLLRRSAAGAIQQHNHRMRTVTRRGEDRAGKPGVAHLPARDARCNKTLNKIGLRLFTCGIYKMQRNPSRLDAVGQPRINRGGNLTQRPDGCHGFCIVPVTLQRHGGGNIQLVVGGNGKRGMALPDAAVRVRKRG